MTIRARLALSYLLTILTASPLFAQCDAPFEEVQRTAVAPGLTSIATGDVDHDGVTDIIVLEDGVPTLYRGLPGGGFAAPTTVGTPRGAELLVLADVNGNGDLDFMQAGGTRLSEHFGDGQGGFAEVYFTTVPMLTRIRGLVAGRFAGPSAAVSLLLADENHSVFLLRGRGDGAFDLPVLQPFTIGASSAQLTTADLDGDGYDDVVLVEFPSTSGVTILHNKGDGTFEKKTAADGLAVTAATVADVDGDAVADLIVIVNNSVSVLRGLGSLQYAAPARVTTLGVTAAHVLAADVNLDGKIDLVVDDLIARQLVVAYGKGDGTFPHVVTSDAAPIPVATLIAARAGTARRIAAIGYTSGELATWEMPCRKRRAVAH
jgi:hypothetical protein